MSTGDNNKPKAVYKTQVAFHSSTNPNERLCDSLIIVTSNAVLDPDRVRELGAHFFLFKPFDLANLQQVLNTAANPGELCKE